MPGVDAIIGGHSHTNPATGFGDYKYLPTFVAGPGQHARAGHPGQPLQHLPGRGRLGLLPDGGGGYEVVVQRRPLHRRRHRHAEDPAIKAIVQPYQTHDQAYNNTVIGADHRADRRPARPSPRRPTAPTCRPTPRCGSWRRDGIPVDFHLSGAMTNREGRRRGHRRDARTP